MRSIFSRPARPWSRPYPGHADQGPRPSPGLVLKRIKPLAIVTMIFMLTAWAIGIIVGVFIGVLVTLFYMGAL